MQTTKEAENYSGPSFEMKFKQVNIAGPIFPLHFLPAGFWFDTLQAG
jgi:hypothetical protein